MAMSKQIIEEYTITMRERYARMTGRRAKTKLLDEFVIVTDWDRKHANKVLLGLKRKTGSKGQRGAPKKYEHEIIDLLKKCWLVMDQPCGKRMKDTLPLWTPYLDVSTVNRQQVERVSAASIDRFLKEFKVQAGKKVRPPKPASGVKSLVEVRAESWDTCEPGWTEVDTVAHCGGDMSGSFIWTLTSVDVASGWTELRAIWNRGQHASLQGLESIYESQPFTLLGLDSDNGGEFLNYFVYDWLKEKGIHQTRSRPYFKNDQAYVEQKNYTHVRSFLGYERLGHQEQLEALNELLQLWSLWKNLYSVTMKQQSRVREGSKYVRRHDKKSYTPAQRLLMSGKLSDEQTVIIKHHLEVNNPFEMQAEIRRLENTFWAKRNDLIKKDSEESLASEGSSPLRSEQPSEALNQQKTKNRRVSLFMRQRELFAVRSDFLGCPLFMSQQVYR